MFDLIPFSGDFVILLNSNQIVSEKIMATTLKKVTFEIIYQSQVNG